MCLSVYVCQLLCKNGRTDPNAVRVIDYNELYLFDGVHMMDATCRIRLNDTCRRRRRRAGCRYRRFYSVLLAIIKLSLTYRAKFGLISLTSSTRPAGRRYRRRRTLNLPVHCGSASRYGGGNVT